MTKATGCPPQKTNDNINEVAIFLYSNQPWVGECNITGFWNLTGVI